MNPRVLKLPLLFLLIMITNELLVDCVETEEEEPKYWEITEQIFVRILSLPANAHGLITGYYMMLPPETRDQIDLMFTQSARKNIGNSDYYSVQRLIVDAILTWIYDHDRTDLDKAMKYAENTLSYLRPSETKEVLFSSHYDAINKLFKKKNLDEDGEDDDDDEEEKEDNFYFTSADLVGKEKLEEINHVIRVLPVNIYWRVNFLRIILNGIIVGKVKWAVEKLIISSIDHYLRPENVEDRNELELALSLSNIFYVVMTLLRKTYRAQQQNNKWNPIASVFLTQTQADDLMMYLPMEVPLQLKNCKYPDIQDIGRTLPFEVKTQVIDLYNCLATYEENIPHSFLWIAQYDLLRSMLAYVEDRRGATSEFLEAYIKYVLKRCKEIGSSEEEAADIKKSGQSSTESTSSHTISPKKISKKKQLVPDNLLSTDKGGVVSSLSNFDWVSPVPNIRSTSTVVNPGHSAKTLQSLMPKFRGGRLKIQQPPQTEIRRGANMASGSAGLPHGMKHLQI